MIKRRKTDIEELKDVVAEHCMRNNVDWEYLLGRAIDKEAEECIHYSYRPANAGDWGDEDLMYWEEAYVANYQLRKFYNSIWGYDCKDPAPAPPKNKALAAYKRYYEEEGEEFPPWPDFIKNRNEAYKGTFSVINNEPRK